LIDEKFRGFSANSNGSGDLVEVSAGKFSATAETTNSQSKARGIKINELKRHQMTLGTMNEQSATSRYVLDIAVGGKLIWIGIKIKN